MALSRPRWRSLKLGDSVVLLHNILSLVAERRFKHKWSEHSRTVYWRKGLMLNLLTGQTMWFDLDDRKVRGEVVKGREG